MIVLSEDNTRMLKLQAGEIDAAMAVPYNQIEPLSQDPNLDVVPAPLYGLINIGLNQTKPELTDIKIRQAMNYAIDREAIVQTALFGQGRVGLLTDQSDLVLHRQVLLHLRSRQG